MSIHCPDPDLSKAVCYIQCSTFGVAVGVMTTNSHKVDPLLWSGGSALTFCIMSRTVHH